MCIVDSYGVLRHERLVLGQGERECVCVNFILMLHNVASLLWQMASGTHRAELCLHCHC